MLKTKIIFTIFVLYEIVAVILLHCPRTCDAMFSGMFCNDHVFKYFLICAAIPFLAFLMWIWINEIFVERRRHRSFLYRAKDVMSDVATDIKERAHKVFDLPDISRHDMDKYLAAAILIGLKKYSDNHPHLRKTVQDIIDGANGKYGYDAHETDSDDSDNEYDADDDDNTRDNYGNMSQSRGRNNNASARRTTTTRTTTTRSKSGGASSSNRRRK